MKGFFNTAQIANKWDMTVMQVQIPGAEKAGKIWIVPEDAIKPAQGKATNRKRKPSLEPLFKFIPYFESKPKYEWGGGECKDGVIQLPYPIYDQTMLDFLHTFAELDCGDNNYVRTIFKKFQFSLIDNDLPKVIPTKPYELVIAILTGYIHQERFWDGLLEGVVQNGTLLAILKRLEELYVMEERE